MTLLYVTVQLPFGCSEAFFLSEIRALQRLGHKVILVPRSPGDRLIHDSALLPNTVAEGLLSHRVLLRAAGFFLLHPLRTLRAAACITRSRSLGVALKNLLVIPKALWLAALARRTAADHIHCQWAATTATMAMLASRLSGVPWSFTAHRGDIVEDNLLALKASQSAFARFVSQDGIRLALARGVGPDADLRLLHTGVDVPPYVSWRPSANPVLLCPARLSPVKGHSVLLHALRLLHDRGLPATLWLAGEGESLASLQALCRSLSLEDAVRFLGPIPHRCLLDCYEQSAVSAVVLPSLDLDHDLHEGIPVALMEAMSYAVPVVSTRTGAIPELVASGSGLLVPPGDAPALAAAIESLLRDPDEAARLGRHGRLRVLEAFDQAVIAQRLADACQAATHHRPGLTPRPAVPAAFST